MRIAICDDDEYMLETINTLLDKYHMERDLEIVCAAFHSPLELMVEIEKGIHYDILFLDVIMPGQNGINAAKEIRQYDSAVKIIFLTSSTEYAVDSYTVGAYFYQLKPIKEEVFFRLMDSAVSECEKAKLASLILRCKNGITRIDLEKLMYCEVIGRTLVLHLEDGRLLESIGSMDELCNELTKHESFLRPHRSFVVNMEYIHSISYKAITMDDHEEIPIPHGKCSEIKNLYLEYAFHRKQALIL